MGVTQSQIQADCGEAFDNVNGGTTAIGALLDKGKLRIEEITGTSTGYDLPVRNLTDALVCQQLLSSSDSTNQSVGIIKIGDRKLIEMRDWFLAECRNSLALHGYSLQSVNISTEVVNQ